MTLTPSKVDTLLIDATAAGPVRGRPAAVLGDAPGVCPGVCVQPCQKH